MNEPLTGVQACRDLIHFFLNANVQKIVLKIAGEACFTTLSPALNKKVEKVKRPYFTSITRDSNN